MQIVDIVKNQSFDAERALKPERLRPRTELQPSNTSRSADDVFTVGWDNSVPNWKVTFLKDTTQYERGTVLEIISSGAFNPITFQYDAPPETRDLSEAFNALVARVVALENS